MASFHDHLDSTRFELGLVNRRLHRTAGVTQYCLPLESRIIRTALSGNDVLVAGWGPDRIYHVEASTGQILQTFEPKDTPTSVAFNTDGSSFAVGYGSGEAVLVLNAPIKHAM